MIVETRYYVFSAAGKIGFKPFEVWSLLSTRYLNTLVACYEHVKINNTWMVVGFIADSFIPASLILENESTIDMVMIISEYHSTSIGGKSRGVRLFDAVATRSLRR